MSDKKVNIAVLVSGGGTNLQAIIDAEKNGMIKSGRISLVISNKEGAYAIERAENAGIQTVTMTRKQCGGQAEFESGLIEMLDKNNIELIVLAGFTAILSEKFTSHYKKRIINIHPSLIPSFCGAGFYGIKVHEAALARGVKITGATVHYVNEIPDGGEIIAQKAVAVCDGDTPEILQKRVMAQAEHIILPAAVEQAAAKIMLENGGRL